MGASGEAEGATLRDHPSLQERVYGLVRRAIVDGRVSAETRLVETEVAQALGVSRNPVREAIRRLQQEGLVVVRPRIGVFVAGLSTKDVEDTYIVRGNLEGLASALAARHATAEELESLRGCVRRQRAAVEADELVAVRESIDAFHNQLHRASRNERLIDLLVRLNDSIARFRAITSTLPARRGAALYDHEQILRALEARDEGRADALMREHVNGSRAGLLAYLASSADGDAAPEEAAA